MAIFRQLSVVRLEYNSVMIGRNIQWFLLLFLCCGDAVSFGQRVTIRVINLNGTPFKNKQVYISGLNAQAASEYDERLKLNRKPIRADLSLLTDSEGQAVFDLPTTLPAYVYVRPVFSERIWDCTCFVSVPTDGLLQKGFLYFSGERKTPKSIQPKPGEILFVMVRTPLWWQLLYPVEKG
jgi:hypothetical protein